jgi:hypothetical protein
MLLFFVDIQIGGLYRHITLGSYRVQTRTWFKHSTRITKYTITSVMLTIQLISFTHWSFSITYIVFIELLHLLLSPITFCRKVFKLHSFVGKIN